MEALKRLLIDGENYSISQFRNYECFEDWKQDAKERKLQKRLEVDADASAKSPEELLIDRENRAQSAKLVFNIYKALGVYRFKILVDCYVFGHTFEELAEQYGYKIDAFKEQFISKSLKIVKRTINQMEEHGEIDGDLFFQQPPIGLPHAVLRPSFLFEDAMKWPAAAYKYRGEYHVRFKCVMPDYLHKSFGDNCTVCSLCMNDLGVNRCKCKKESDA